MVCIVFYFQRINRKLPALSNISIVNGQRHTQHEHLVVVGQSELMGSPALLADPAVLPIERRPRKRPFLLSDADLGAEAVYRFAERGVDAHVLLLAGPGLGNGCILKHDQHTLAMCRNLAS